MTQAPTPWPSFLCRWCWCDVSGSGPGVLHDPVKDPPAAVLTADALGPLEQAQPPSRASRWMLREKRIRSEERRVGKEGRSRWSPYGQKKKKRKDRRYAK